MTGDRVARRNEAARTPVDRFDSERGPALTVEQASERTEEPIAPSTSPASAGSGDGERFRLWDFLKGYRLALASVAATSLAGGLTEAAFLVLVTRAAFAVSEKESDLEAFYGMSLTVSSAVLVGLVLVMLRVGFGVLTGWQAARLTSTVVARTRKRLARAFLATSWEVQQDDRTGRLQELLTTFSQQAFALINSLTTATSSLFSLLALLGIAVAVDPVGALVVIVAVGVLGSLLRPVRAAVKRRGKRSAEVGMHFATSLSEVSQLGLEMHVFHVQDQTGRRVMRLIDDTAAAERRLSFAKGLVPTLYTGLAYLALVGALAAVSLSKGTSLVALGAVILVMLRSLTYGQALQAAQAGITSTMPYLQTLKSQLDVYTNGRRHDGGQAVEHVGTLEFRDVSFSYSQGHEVLRNISFSMRPREIVGIVGPSGSGKSTLVQLLLGLRDPNTGEVLADGRPIADLSKEAWARRVTFVPQGAHLVAGTISENIRFFRDDVTSEQVIRAADMAHLRDDIERMAGGFDREVGEGGGHLSGGQQQRLCIARALVESPDVLILDEPTSALDVKSEHLIRQTLSDLASSMTVVIIAHRLSTLDICDRILVLQDGEIRGFETPAQLAATNDFYIEALRLSGLQ